MQGIYDFAQKELDHGVPDIFRRTVTEDRVIKSYTLEITTHFIAQSFCTGSPEVP